MSHCKQCHSFAINHGCHGRDGSDADLCDVCYWRKRADELRKELAEADTLREAIAAPVTGWDTGLSQDYDRKLGKWFADQPGALQQLREDAQPTDTDILKLAHRMAWRYKHSTLSSGIEYTFNNRTLLDFVRALRGLK